VSPVEKQDVAGFAGADDSQRYGLFIERGVGVQDKKLS
jgi:hypothetical protein